MDCPADVQALAPECLGVKKFLPDAAAATADVGTASSCDFKGDPKNRAIAIFFAAGEVKNLRWRDCSQPPLSLRLCDAILLEPYQHPCCVLLGYMPYIFWGFDLSQHHISG